MPECPLWINHRTGELHPKWDLLTELEIFIPCRFLLFCADHEHDQICRHVAVQVNAFLEFSPIKPSLEYNSSESGF